MALSKYSNYNVKEVLNGYKTNKCRLCDELFCCPNCRLRHEGSTHEINVGCYLCVYGFIIMGQIDSYDLTEHIIKNHLLPISRCAYCETLISADAIYKRDNNLCTLTNFTDEEIEQIWCKLPEDLREEILLPCHSNNAIEEVKNDEKEGADDIVSGSTDVEEVHYDSPTLCLLKRQQLFETGGFTNSTPVTEPPKSTNMESVEEQVKLDSLSSKDKNTEMFEDTIKKRKVQFDVTPQPVISKTPSSFQGAIKKSSFKKMKNKIENDCNEGGVSLINIEIKAQAEPNPQQTLDKRIVEDKQSMPKEKIAILVKPMQRDASSSSNMEIVNQLSFNGSEDCRWFTAVEELSELDTEKSISAEISRTSDILNSDNNIVQDIDAQTQLASSIQESSSTGNVRFDAMQTAKNVWTICKSKLFQFKRTSVKRLRSELDISVEEREGISTPMNERKRRRFLECRRPIHYYIKPEVNRDVKKISIGMQTSTS